MDEPVIIVDAEGVEHEFPPGMDPKRAAAIVKQKSAPAPNMQAKGGDTINGQDPNAEPSFFTRLGGMMESAASPDSLGDFLQLIIPSSLMKGAAAERGVATIGKGVEKAGDITLKAGEGMKSPSLMMAGADALNGGDLMRPAAIAAAPYATRGAGRVMRGAGRILQKGQDKPPVPGVGMPPESKLSPILKRPPIPEHVEMSPRERLGALTSDVESLPSVEWPVTPEGPAPPQSGLSHVPRRPDIPESYEMPPRERLDALTQDPNLPPVEWPSVDAPQRPAFQQVEDVVDRPNPVTRGAGEPPAVQGDINDLPLWKQMEMLAETDPAPNPNRFREPPMSEVPTLQGEAVPDAPPPSKGFTDAEFVEEPALGLPPAGSRQMDPTSELEEAMFAGHDPTPQQSVVNYTDEAPAMIGDTPDPNAILGDAAMTDVMEAQGIPLGKPRVLSWKSGQGPSDELLESTRAAEGSKGAARRLGLSQAQVKARTGSTPRGLPTEAQGRIRTAMESMTPEEKLAYLESSPNDISAEFIRSILGS